MSKLIVSIAGVSLAGAILGTVLTAQPPHAEPFKVPAEASNQESQALHKTLRLGEKDIEGKLVQYVDGERQNTLDCAGHEYFCAALLVEAEGEYPCPQYTLNSFAPAAPAPKLVEEFDKIIVVEMDNYVRQESCTEAELNDYFSLIDEEAAEFTEGFTITDGVHIPSPGHVNYQPGYSRYNR